jgi:hypothetical protein
MDALIETHVIIMSVCIIGVVYGALEIYFHRNVGFRQKKSWKK